MPITHLGRFRPAIHVFAIALAVALMSLAGPLAAPHQTGAAAHGATDTKTDTTIAGAVLKRKAKQPPAGERIVRVAARQAGDPYRWGAAGPNAFDCSGLTMYAVRLATGKRLPHSSSAQRGATRRISAGAARRGDLVFFHGPAGVYHVAIYAGSRKVWHSPRTGSRVHKAAIWTSSVSYGRVR